MKAGSASVSAKDATLVESFAGRVVGSLQDQSFVRLLLSSPAPDAAPIDRIMARLIILRDQPALSVTLREKTRDTTRNLTLQEVPGWLRRELTRFRAALLETHTESLQLSALRNGNARLARHRAPPGPPPARTHDRPTHRALDPTANDWMQALGLIDAAHRVLPRRADKYHQIERYAEILGHLARDAGWKAGDSFQVADMGCGRGHLTFAAWQLLRRQLQFDAEVTGIEVRAELADEAEKTARELKLDGLRFVLGDVGAIPLPRLGILIALHACNTATDDAIRRGIELGARLILVAPCCHQEIRPQLGRPEPLAGVLRHGIMAERLAEWVTDGLRALALEAAGYKVKVIEFVASEHTPKNLLIAGIHSPNALRDCVAVERIRALKDFFGITRHALDAVNPPP